MVQSTKILCSYCEHYGEEVTQYSYLIEVKVFDYICKRHNHKDSRFPVTLTESLSDTEHFGQECGRSAPHTLPRSELAFTDNLL